MRHFRRFLTALTLSAAFAMVQVAAQGQSGAPTQTVPVPIPSRNVNMVSGTNFPTGDPFLQRQNEPSLAVSTRNVLHLFGAANDYRTVDIPGLPDEVNGDAWIGIFKSFDGGGTWQSTLLPGFRQDRTAQGLSSPLFGLEAAADPVVRAGTNGLFYLSGIAFNRESSENGKVFLARYIDNNNLEAGDSIKYLGTTVVDIGTETRFIDKPWLAVDIARGGTGKHKDDDDGKHDDKDKDKDKDRDKDDNGKSFGGASCQIPGQARPIPAGSIYLVYSVFISPSTTPTTGHDNDHDRDRDHDRDHDRHGEHHEMENGENHKPGQPMEGRTQIMLARSMDCGATFSRPTRISERTQINQGSVAAIDPNTGAIYVAWREFMSAMQPDAILITKSTDGGDSFSDPVTVSRINPFDQGTSPTSFRTNAYPALAVDGTGRVYVAWAQRGVGPAGDARIVVTTARQGKSWTPPVAADNPPQRGHQFMPVLSFGGGNLHLVFWDQRDDKSGIFDTFIDEAPILNWTGPGPRPTRHTLDLRGVASLPGDRPTFGPSVKLSQYLEGVRNGPDGKSVPQQLQFNPPNLPLFSLGTVPFIGDYLDVSASPSFIPNGDGTWRYNTLSSDPGGYFTSWADNRDVRAPQDGNWAHYTPPTFAGSTGTSLFDPSQPLELCSPGQAGMRNQNIYSTRVTTGLVATTPGNNKPLGTVTDANGTRLIQRTFVVSVSNPEATGKSVILHIPTQPPGGRASFLQFAPLADLPVNIAAKSSISREVFVTSTDRHASVPITVEDAGTHTTVTGVLLNPDITNPDITNPDITNPDITNPDITNAEAHAVTVSNPDITNPDITNITLRNPDITNPDITNPDITNPDITNANIINPDITNPDITNPDITNPDITNPDITNPDITNAALTDVTWNVSNVGNTATSYQMKLLLKQAEQQRLLGAGVKFQLVVTKTTAAPLVDNCKVTQPHQNLTVLNIISPAFVDPTNAQQLSAVVTPDITNPDITNATMALAPGDTARVTLRVFSPIGDTTTGGGPGGSTDPLQDLTGALEDLKHVGVATTSHPVDTLTVNAGGTTPAIQASIPIIVTTTLPDGARLRPYSAAIEARGTTAPSSFAIVTGALPPGLTLTAETGVIAGTPTASGVFTFTVLLTDAHQSTATATLTIRVFEPLVVVTAPVPGAIVNQPYTATVTAAGGFAPDTWTTTGGSLPAGVTLTSAGVLTGTPTQSGTFTFTATATDTASPGQIASGSIALTVTPGANGQSVTLAENTPTAIVLSGTGAAPGALTFAIGNQPTHGALSGTGPTFTYTPALNYNGPDSFTFRVTQGALTSAFATVSITVTAVNQPPTATPQTVQTPQGVAKAIVLTGTDPENSPLTFSIVTNPANATGTLSGSGATRTFTPAGGFSGTTTFTFRANDGTLNSTPATVTIIVGPPPAGSADVTLTLTDAPDPVILGNTVTFTALLHNNGPAPATGVILTLAYSAADLTRLSITPSQGTCGTGNPISCNLGALPIGGNATVAVALRASNHGGTVITAATVATTSLDYNTSNNTASQSTTVTGPAIATTDLSVTQSSAPNPVAVGSNVVYTIVVSNNGPSDATGVTLSNAFTAAATLVSTTAGQGVCSNRPNQVVCSVGSLAKGASATYAITLKAIAGGTLSNTATVTGTQTDPSAANNSNTTSTTVSNQNPTAVNDSATTREDTPTTILVLANDTDPDGNALTVTAATPAIHGSTVVSGGTVVVYTPAPNYNGPDSFTYTISDGHGGTASATVSVTVLAVNDAPSFAKGPNQTVDENAGARIVPGWATAISAGPADESGQALTFIVSNDNHALFSTEPDVAANGTLTYTVAANTQGSANVTVVLQDNGGTANGGADSSAVQTFTITVMAVNSAPAFTKGADQTVREDDGVQSVPGWATAISAGPPDESGQVVTFYVSNDNVALFSAQPSIAANGTLSYAPAANANGSATVTVQLHDNGGTANGGIDTSAAQTFLITVLAVNDAPSFARGADQTVFDNAGPRSIPGWATLISAGPANESAQTVAFHVTAADASLFAVQPSIDPSGTLTFTPAHASGGSTIVTVTLQDNGGTANGGVDTSVAQTFTIAVTRSHHPPVATDDTYNVNEDGVLAVSACLPTSASFPDFVSTSGLALNGTAEAVTTADGGVIRLASALPDQSGSVYTTDVRNVSRFSTTFNFRLTNPGGGADRFGSVGADGVMFVMQRAGNTALGESGGGLGYLGVAPSVAVEFDTWANEWDPSSNHIGINFNGSVQSVQTIDISPDFDDGTLKTAWIDYDGVTLEVRVGPAGEPRPGVPQLSMPIDIPGILGAPTAYVGFSAATGQVYENVDVVSWSYASTCVPTVLANDTDADGNPLTAILVAPPSNGSVELSADGTFIYSPATNFFGTDAFTYKANDGFADSDVATVTITVNPVNDPPSFIAGPNQTVPGDGATVTVPGWATAISAGPANESGQTVEFFVFNDSDFLITQPTVDVTGALTFATFAGGQGTAVVTVQAHDNGGTANGGIDTSAPQTFTITVLPATPTQPTDLVALSPHVGRVNLTWTDASSNETRFDIAEDDSLGVVRSVGANITTASFAGLDAGTSYHWYVRACNEAGCSAWFGPIGKIPDGSDHTPTFTPTGSLNFPRTTHQATLLVDGRVLATGGHDVSGASIAEAEIFDPATGAWSIASSNVIARQEHTATRLQDGRVLVVGGTSSFSSCTSNATAETFDPSTGVWSPTGALPAPVGSGLVAVRLLDGRVLASGGGDRCGSVFNSAALFDPFTNTWTATGSMTVPREFHSAARLPDGRVLVAGGATASPFNFVASAETYDPTTGTWTPVGSMTTARGASCDGYVLPYLAPLPSGDVLAAGAFTGSCSSGAFPTATAELYNSANAAWGTTGSMDSPRGFTTLTVLVDGTVLVAGGFDGSGNLSSAVVFDPATGAWSATGVMSTPRAQHTATRLLDGDVLIAGGMDTSSITATAEIYQAAPAASQASLVATTTGNAATIYPAAFDSDPDSAPAVVAAVTALPPGSPNLAAPGQIAVAPGTGLVYFTSPNRPYGTRIGVMDPATNSIVAVIPVGPQTGQTAVRVNRSTNIIYFRAGSNIVAVDARPGATQNTVLASLTIGGTIRSLAIDEQRGVLYVTNDDGSGVDFQSRVTVIDANPSSPTFHRLIDNVVLNAGGTAQGIAVNASTNKIYVAALDGGVYVLNGATHALTRVSGVSALSSAYAVAINEPLNLVYATAQTGSSPSYQVLAIDGASDVQIAAVAVPGRITGKPFDRRLLIDPASGRVFAKESGTPSRVFVIDGSVQSPSFNTLVAQIPTGRDDTFITDFALDSGAGRLVTTADNDHETQVIDIATLTVVASIPATDEVGLVAIDAGAHIAYVTGPVGALQSIRLSGSPALLATVQVGSYNALPVLNPVNHHVYVGVTGLTSTVKALDRFGELVPIAGLPHENGAYYVAAVNPATDRVYVTNIAANIAGNADALPGFVSVIDGATDTVVANVPAGSFPSAVAVNTSTNTIYVGNDDPGVTVIDGVTNAAVGADVSALPGASFLRLVVNEATNRVYLQASTNSDVIAAVLEGATNVVTAVPGSLTGVNLIQVDSSRNRVYIGTQDSAGTNVVHVLDGSTHAELAAITVGSPSQFTGAVFQSYLAFNTVTGKIFVSDYVRNTVSVVDANTFSVIKTLAVGAGPVSIAVNENRNRIYVANALDRSLTFIDGNTLRIDRSVPLPVAILAIVVDEANSVIFGAAAPQMSDSGLVVVSDPPTANGPPAVTNVTQGASGSVTVNDDGTLRYQPNTGFSGSDSFSYTVSDGHGNTTSRVVNVTVNPQLSITTSALPDAAVGQSYEQVLGAAGGIGSYGWSIVTATGQQLPSGLALNSFGVLNGKPSKAGSFAFTVEVSDAAAEVSQVQHATRSFVITVGGDRAPVAVEDSVNTTTGSAVTIYPGANDTDPDNPSPSLLTTVRFPLSGAPNLTFPSAIAVLPKPSSSDPGVAYFGASGQIGILDTTLGEVVGAIPLAPPVAATIARANLTTRFVYFAAGNRLIAVDGRPSSPTQNQAGLSLTIGSSIRTLTLDESRGRLYVATQANSGIGSLAQSQVSVLDVDPVSPTFHQIVGDLSLPGGVFVLDAAINAITNKLYIGVSGANGLLVLDCGTLTISAIPTPTAFSVAVNETSDLIYAVLATGQVASIDGVTDTVLATIPVTTNLVFTGEGRLAIHNGTGRVFFRTSNAPQSSVVAVIDGDRNSPTFNTMLAQIPAGWETSQGYLAVDQAAARVIFTTPGSLSSTIINAQTNAVVGTVHAPQTPGRVVIDASTDTAYVSGAIGFVQAISLNSATSLLAQTGVEATFPVVDPIAHVAYVPRTGVNAGLAVIDATGLQSTVVAPAQDGRFTFAARNGATNFIYAANSGANAAGTADATPGFVSVIDAGTRSVVVNVQVGQRPLGLAVDDVLNKVYVGNTSVLNDISANYQTTSGITVIDGATNAATPANLSAIVAGPLSVQQQMAVNTATGKMYFRIASGATTTIGVLDGATNIGTPLPASLGPVSIIRVNPVLNRVYIGSTTGVLHVLNGSTDAEIATLNVGGASAVIGTQSYLAVNRTTGRVYVANFSLNTLSIIDGTTNTIVSTIPVGRGPTSVAVNETSNRIYVANALDKTLMIVNGATAKVESIVTLPMQPIWLDVDPTVSQVYALGGCPAASSLCTSFETGVMVISDPANPNGALALTSVTQGASGAVVLNADGSVSYTPNAGFSGTDSFTYTVTDGHGATSSGTVNVTINSPPTITTSSLPPTLAGHNYAQTLAASGGVTPYTWSVTSGQLPPGLFLNADSGGIGGTAVGSGTFAPTFQARDRLGNQGFATLAIVVGPPVVITSFLPSGFVGQSYNQTLSVGGNVGTTLWSVGTGALPNGLTISADGVISGTPTTYGNASFTVQAQDSLGHTGTRALSIFVDSNLAITTTTLNEGVIFSTSGFSIFTIGGHGALAFTLDSGSPPPGVILSSSGFFSGTPTATGPFNFVVRVTDCSPSTSCATGTVQQTATQAYTQNVSALDQTGSSDTSSPGLTFGGPGGLRIAERVTTGLTGSLRGFRVFGITCPIGTTLTIDVQGVAANGGPDGATIATGTGLSTPGTTILFGGPPFFEADQPFTLVVGSSAACTAQPSTFDSYNGGDGYVGAPWLPLLDYSEGSYFDIPFQTLVQPAAGLSYMSSFRSNGVAVTLTGGRVLVSSSGTAEVFDPTAAKFTTTGSLQVARNSYTMTLLNDGTVLAIGGSPNTGGAYLATAELYHPDTGQWELLTATMIAGRLNHTATKLSCPAANPSCSLDGKVLVAGGYNYDGTTVYPVTALELYDPSSKRFTSIGSLSTARYLHTATLLQCPASNPSCGWDSSVLVAGGYLWSGAGASAEIVNVATGVSTPTSGAMRTPRSVHTATPMADGRVLIAGGLPVTNGRAVVSGAELFDPQTGQFAAAGNTLTPRWAHTANALADGSVLLAGGVPDTFNQNAIASMERFVPGKGFIGAGSLLMTRQAHSAATLPDGRIVIAGGFSGSNLTGRSAEIVDPTVTPSILNPILPTGGLTAFYSAVIAPTGGSGQPYTLALASSAQTLPPGLAFDTFTCLVGCSVTIGTNITAPIQLPLTPPIQLGRISGTPTAVGTYAFDLRVTDSTNHSADQTLTIRINPLDITTPVTLTSVSLGAPYTTQLTASGTGPLTWRLMPGSSLPAGLTLSSTGVLSGTFTGSDSFFSFRVSVTDAFGQTATRQFSLSANQWIDQTNFGDGVSVNTLSMAGANRIAQTVSTGVTGYLGGVILQTLSCSTNPVTVTIQGVSPTTGAPDDGQIFATATATITRTFQTIPISPSLLLAADAKFAIVLSSSGGSCQVTNSSVGSDFSAYQDGAAFQDLGGGWSRLSDGPTGIADIQFETIANNPALIHTNSYLGHTSAVRLQNGKTLFVGGNGTAELYDPATNTSSTRTMLAARSYATVTLLRSGKVLVTGGIQFTNPAPWIYHATAELYDPALDTFAPVASSMSIVRFQHRATLMADGRVLITGGVTTPADPTTTNWGPPLQTAEIFDPSTMSFTPAASMLDFRNSHEATLLLDGRVLVTGGWGGTSFPYISAELYSPISDSWTAASMLLPRANHTATRLSNGTVLIAGGQLTRDVGLAPTGEIFNPSSGTFATAGSLVTGRFSHTATLLNDGSVLFTGGIRNNDYFGAPWASAERYIAGTGFVGAASMLITRDEHAAALLADGRVAIGGGFGTSSQTGSTLEVYDPRPNSGSPGILNPIPPDGSKNVPYGPFTFAPVGGAGQPYSIQLVPPANALPPGLAFDVVSCALGCTLSNGTPISAPIQLGRIQGTPTASGTYSFDVRVADSLGRSADQTLRIRIDGLDITTGFLPSSARGQTYFAQLSSSGGVGSVSWAIVSGGLPPGLSLAGDTITGTVAATAIVGTNYNFTVRAVDDAGQRTVRNMWIYIYSPPPLTINTAQLGDAVAPWSYGWCFGSQGGIGAVHWSIPSGHAPYGLTLQDYGCFTGSVLQTGMFQFDVMASAGTEQTTRTVTVRAGVADQAQFAIDSQVVPVAIPFGGNVNLAQVFTTAMSGNLLDIQIPVSCTATGMRLEIRGVTSGQPDATLLAQQDFTAADVMPFQNGVYHRQLRIAAPIFLARGTQVAAVLSSSGSCSVVASQANQAYGFGDAFTGTTGNWTALGASDPSRPDIPFEAIMDDGGRLLFEEDGRSEAVGAVLGSGPNAGMVLLAGGNSSTASLFNATDHTVGDVPTHQFGKAGSLLRQRRRHTGTTLSDGRVLVVGGWDDSQGAPVAELELYDPSADQWSVVATLHVPRFNHIAALLTGDRVLIAGGQTQWGGNALNSTEVFVYDGDGAGHLIDGPPMNDARAEFSATTLPNSQVAVIGGWGMSTPRVELYTPGEGIGTFTVDATLQVPRSRHSALLLTCPTLDPSCSYGGKVLVFGGWLSNSFAAALQSELYDPSTHTSTLAGIMTSERAEFAAAQLANGTVIAAGGDQHSGATLSSIEAYDWATGAWKQVGDMVVPRGGVTVVRLTGDSLLLVGGWGASAASWASAELLHPATDLFPSAVANSPFSAAIPASGVTPFTFTLRGGTLPAGLSLDSATGIVSGTPSDTGVFTFVVEVRDSATPNQQRFFEATIQIDGPLPPGNVNAVIVDPTDHQTLYAATSGGVHKSVDGGHHWSWSGLMLVNGIAFDPTNTATIHAATNFGVAKSTDGGQTWTPSGGPGCAYAIAVDGNAPQTVYAGTCGWGLYKSVDGGVTWASTNLTTGVVSSVAIDPSQAGVVYAVTSFTSLLKSSDGGQTWSTSDGISGYLTAVRIDPTDHSVVYVAAGYAGVFKSSDAGQTWTAKSAPPTTDLEIAPSDHLTLYAGSWTGVSKSTDGGETWSVSTGPSGTAGVAIDPINASTAYAATTGYGVFKTTTSGVAWETASVGINALGVPVLAVDADGVAYAGTNGRGAFRSVDHGTRWVGANSGLDPNAYVTGFAVSSTNDHHVWIAANNIFLSKNAGQTWTRTNVYATAVVVDPSIPTTVYALGYGGLSKSSDEGQSWSLINIALAAGYNSALLVDPHDSATLFASVPGSGVFKSTDGGYNWASMNAGLVSLWVEPVIMDPNNSNLLYAGTNAGAFRSIDGGQNWTSANLPQFVRALALDPANSSVVLAGTTNGFFKSIDSGATWTASNAGLTQPAIRSLATDRSAPGTIFAGTEGGGLFRSTDGGTTWQRVGGS